MNLCKKSELWYKKFEENKCALADTFATVLGEKYRDLIIERLNNTYVIPYEFGLNVASNGLLWFKSAIYSIINQNEQIKSMQEDNSEIFKQVIYGEGVMFPGLIEYFSEESEELLNSDNTSIFQKIEILQNRIKYFCKVLGINEHESSNYDELKSEYEKLYKIVEKEKKIWIPNETIVDLISKSRKSKVEKYLQEIDTEEHSTYSINQKQLNDLNLLQNIDFFSTIRNGCMFQTTAMREKEDGTMEMVNIIFFPMASDNYPNKNELISHEVYHAITSQICDLFYREYYNRYCGFNYNGGIPIRDFKVDAGLPSKPIIDEDKQSYRSFNEVFTQIIAIEVANELKKRNIHILEENESNYSIGGHCGYETMIPVVNEFFQEYRKEIIDRMMDYTSTHIYKRLGKEKIEKGKKKLSKINEILKMFFERHKISQENAKKRINTLLGIKTKETMGDAR